MYSKGIPKTTQLSFHRPKTPWNDVHIPPLSQESKQYVLIRSLEAASYPDSTSETRLTIFKQ
jgi:hypothetical protein